jgi:hypothetical protein
VARIQTGANASVKTSQPIVTYLAAERSMPPSSPAHLHYVRDRVDACRLLREMDVVVRAWHWGVTFATAKGCRRSLLELLTF